MRQWHSHTGILLFIIALGLLVFLASSTIGIVAADNAPVEQWSRTFGGTENDWFESVAVGTDGYVFAGWINPQDPYGSDAFAVKFDAAGNELWSHSFGGESLDSFYAVEACPDGGYILAVSTSTGSWAVKLDASGDESWNNEYSIGYRFNSVAACPDGGYVLVGNALARPEDWDYDGVVVKVDADGNEQWSRTFGGTEGDFFESVAVGTDGYLIAGWTESQGAGGYDGWVVKLDTSGNQQWSKTFGGMDRDMLYGMHACSDGGYVLAGDTLSLGAGSSDGWLIKIDSVGNELWSQTYGGPIADLFFSVDICPDGGFVLAGQFYSLGAGFDGWVVKVDSAGNQEWNQTFGGTREDTFESVAASPDGGYVLAGYTESQGAGKDDCWAVKIGSGTAVTTTMTATSDLTTITTSDHTTTTTPATGLLITIIYLIIVTYVTTRLRRI